MREEGVGGLVGGCGLALGWVEAKAWRQAALLLQACGTFYAPTCEGARRALYEVVGLADRDREAHVIHTPAHASASPLCTLAAPLTWTWKISPFCCSRSARSMPGPRGLAPIIRAQSASPNTS